MSEPEKLTGCCIYCGCSITYGETQLRATCPGCRETFSVVKFQEYRDKLKETEAEKSEYNKQLQEKQLELSEEKQKTEDLRQVLQKEQQAAETERKKAAEEKRASEERLGSLLRNLDRLDSVEKVLAGVADTADTAGGKLDALLDFTARIQQDFNTRFSLMMELSRKDEELGKAIYALIQEQGAANSEKFQSLKEQLSALRKGQTKASDAIRSADEKLSAVQTRLNELDAASDSRQKTLLRETEEIKGKITATEQGIHRLETKLVSAERRRAQAACLEGDRLKAEHHFTEAYKQYQKAIEYGGEELLNPAELHWRKLLCRYGVEYVYSSYQKAAVPTLFRNDDMTPVPETPEARDLLACCPEGEKTEYRRKLKELDGIIEEYARISYDAHFDIFISVKQKDGADRWTKDSETALNLYLALQREGYTVFNSRVEGCIPAGANYEPYIMSALRNARVLIVVSGEKADKEQYPSGSYLDAAWVKNEWARFQWIMEHEEDNRRLLIPYLYGEMGPSGMPRALREKNYQCIECRPGSDPFGILQTALKAVFNRKSENGGRKTAEPRDTTGSEADTESLIKRGFLSLEDGEWAEADGYFERALDRDAENARAYLGKFFAAEHVPNAEALQRKWLAELPEIRKERLNIPENTEAFSSLQKACPIAAAFDAPKAKEAILRIERGYLSGASGAEKTLAAAKEKCESNRFYNRALKFSKGMEKAQTEKIAGGVILACLERLEKEKQAAESARKERQEAYDKAVSAEIERQTAFYANTLEKLYLDACRMAENAADAKALREAARCLERLKGYKDAAERARDCVEKSAMMESGKTGKWKKILIFVAIAVVVIVALVLLIRCPSCGSLHIPGADIYCVNCGYRLR